MRQGFKKAALGAAAIGVLALAVAPASADYAPSGNDILAIGGDTPQVTFNFAADGDHLGDLGYNAAGLPRKLVSFDATADANGRNAYVKGTSTALNPTVVFRAGTSPIQRIPSTGTGYNALIADTGAVHQINVLRAATPPTAAQQNLAAAAPNVGPLRVVQIAWDGVEIAAANTTNAPAGLTLDDLFKIYTGVYTKWNQIPNNAGGSGSTIIPLLPPDSSAIKRALTDAFNATYGTSWTLTGAVQRIEQNDPTVITLAASPADAITPISTARLNLWNNDGGYYRNPNTVFPGGATTLPGIHSLTGTPVSAPATAAWTSTNGIYAVFRQSDFDSTTPWQPGSTKNWVKTLFADPTGSPYFKKATGQALIAAAGDTPYYEDLGSGYSVG